MKLVIATKNNGKIEGAKSAFECYFKDVEIKGIPVLSEVSDQPVNEETYLGCKNRIKNLKNYCKENKIEADYYLAIESRLSNQLGKWLMISIAMIEDKNGFQSIGTTSGFPVPERYVEEIKQTEFSELMNRLFTKDDQRHNQGGGIQLLTHNEITRIGLTKQAFIMALTQYINGEIWK